MTGKRAGGKAAAAPGADDVGAIRVRGARAHNLRAIDVVVPHGALTVVTGPSGSGKSSLAFDVVHAEAERRFFAAHGEGQALAPAAVDDVSGLLPALAVRQTPPRLPWQATVATLARVSEPLRVAFARFARIHCPRCGELLEPLARSEIVDRVLLLPEGSRLVISAPLDAARWNERPSAASLQASLDELVRRGHARMLVDGATHDLVPRPALAGAQAVDLVIDRIVLKDGVRARLAESIELALREGAGTCRVTVAARDPAAPSPGKVYADHARCVRCALELPPIDARTFSHHSPEGACPVCRGTGEVLAIDPDRVVPDPSLSLDAGAIAPFGEPGSARHRARLSALRQVLDVPSSIPFGELPESVRQAILFGGSLAPARKKKAKEPEGYEGVVPLLTRRLAELEARVELGDEDTWAALEEELGAFRSRRPCAACGGARLGPIGRTATLLGATLPELTALDAPSLAAKVSEWPTELSPLLSPLRTALLEQLALLSRVGLGYLALDRGARTLSAGEAQRIRLADVLGSALSHLLYVLDEPSQGLHPRDVASVIAALASLRSRNGTLLVVEHERSVIAAADRVIELGPGAGRAGGALIAEGTLAELRALGTLTARALDAELELRSSARAPRGELRIEGARLHNLAGISVSFARGALNVVAGVSGAGKSSLLACIDGLTRSTIAGQSSALGDVRGKLSGAERLVRVLTLDEAPMGRSARSSPATFLGVLGPLRDLFVQLPDAKARGWDSARFTYNVPGGRCERCQGDGVIEVRVLGSVQLLDCPLCHGARYERETLEVRWRGMSIADVLALSIEEALRQFESIPAVVKRLTPARKVGLGYLTLGQRAGTLSGGEAQRLALARELAGGGAGETLYLLDEPTRGLHLTDVDALTDVLEALVDEGHTVIVAAHALALIGAADRVIELGPGGGPHGGLVVFAGTPAALATQPTATGEALRAR